MPEKDSKVRFAVAASNADRAKPILLAGGALVVLLAVAWLIFGGGGEADKGPAQDLAEIQRASYERRIETLKKEIDALAKENEKLRSALLKAQSELVDFQERLRRESGNGK